VIGEEEVRERLEKYLRRDKDGIRREVLKILVEGREYTTEEVYEELRRRGREVEYRKVMTMLGLMMPRLGIVRTKVGEKHRYYVKPEYVDLVRTVLERS